MPVLAIVLALTSCGPDSIIGGVPGSGHPATESRQVGSYSRIEIEGSAEVQVTINPVSSLSVTTDDNLLPFVQTAVSGETLKIGWTKSAISTLGAKVQIAVPSLEALSISGSGKIQAEGIKESALSMSIAGSGEIAASGKADICTIDVNGSGRIQARNLQAQDSKVAILGSGSVTVWTDHSLDASIMGSGAIIYYGNPGEIKKNVVGSGALQAR